MYKLHLKSSKSSIFLFLGIVLMPFFYFPVFFGFRIKKDYTNNCFFPFAFCSTVFLYLFQILLRERILPDAKTDFWKSHFFLFKSVILFFTFVFYFRFLLLQSKAFHEDRSHRNHFLVTVHSVLSNTLRDAGNMNLLVQSPRSIVCFANLIYAIRINSRGVSRDFGILMPKRLAG